MPTATTSTPSRMIHCTTSIATSTAMSRELERQQANIVKELRELQSTGDEDLDRQWRGQLRDSFSEVADQRKALQTQLADITKMPEATPATNPRLLDRLPVIDTDSDRLSEELEREPFSVFQLQVRYHQPTPTRHAPRDHRRRGDL